MDAMNVGPVLAVVTASGTAITVITEVCKAYVPKKRCPPPIVAGVIAMIFTLAWSGAQPILPDTFSLLMIWFALFQVSASVYHLTQLSERRRAAHDVPSTGRTRETPHA